MVILFRSLEALGDLSAALKCLRDQFLCLFGFARFGCLRWKIEVLAKVASECWGVVEVELA